MPAHSCFRAGPNGEWIRVPDDGSHGRVDYMTDGRAWPSDTEITLERMKAPENWRSVLIDFINNDKPKELSRRVPRNVEPNV